MNEERRQQLIDKYGMNNPPQRDNRVVRRIIAGERLHAKVFTRDAAELFDPIRCPTMYAKAQAALDAAHTLITSRRDDDECDPWRCNSHDDDERDPFAPLSPDDPALYVYKVGDSSVTVCRGPKPLGAFARATYGYGPQPGSFHDGGRRNVEYFAGMYRLMTELHNDF